VGILLFVTDQLFVDGERQPLARDPNFDPAERHFNGWASDAISPARAARWKDPRGGFIHALHAAEWGGMHYVITGKNANDNITYEGGWQNNRPMGMHKIRVVENIFEELDAAGEWFLDKGNSLLYFYPPAGLNLGKATFEAVRLKHLVEFRGTEQAPVRFVSFKGLTFRHAARTFMENKEPLVRSDWTTYRGGAIFLNGAEDCAVEDCLIDQVGGNAIFENNYNRRIKISGCDIHDTGASAVAFVGSPDAVRNPLFEYNQRQNYNAIDKTPGPEILHPIAWTGDHGLTLVERARAAAAKAAQAAQQAAQSAAQSAQSAVKPIRRPKKSGGAPPVPPSEPPF
jgi:hypothetical protein